MKKNIKTLKSCPLFAGMIEEEILSMLKCLSAREKTYEKNEFILLEGDSFSDVGIVLSGSVHIFKEDFWGNRTIMSQVQSGDIFGESFSFSEEEKLPVNAMATEKTNVLFVDYDRITKTCSSSCSYHNALIKNMLKIFASKNILLTRKIDHLSKRNTREKLLSYLSEESKKVSQNSFAIPFNRQELADYLSVDRSAMSSELGKMRDEGLLAFRKNLFILY